MRVSVVKPVRARLQRSQWVGARRMTVAAVVAIGLLAGVAAQRARAATPPPQPIEVDNQFFDWFNNSTPSYLPSPFLTNQTASAVDAFFQQLPPDAVRAVKVEHPISIQTSNLIFNNPNYHVSYVLGDIERPNAPDLVKALAEQVRYVNGNPTGVPSRSHNAFVGSYGFQDLLNDVTVPPNWSSQQGQHSWSGWGKQGYDHAKLNLSMPELYPGSGSLRTPTAGTSSAPNIRSALFTLPALRLSQVAVNKDANERIIPWVARFNNSGNLAFDTDRNPANGFVFEPGKPMPAAFGLPAVSASQTQNQMLSRRDFAAQVAHYRLRGADSYVLFEPGVIGYSQEDKRTDARAGWTEPHVDAIFTAPDARLLLGVDSDYASANSQDANSRIIVDGQLRSIEEAGALFSGVYSLGMERMDVLFSNLTETSSYLTLPPRAGGFDIRTRSFSVDAGAHLLVEFKLTQSGPGRGWSVALQHVPFTHLPTDRTGFGIPEPTGLTFLAATMFLAFSPRRRKRLPGAEEDASPPARPTRHLVEALRPATRGLVGANLR